MNKRIGELEKLIDVCTLELTEEEVSKPRNIIHEAYNKLKTYQAEYKQLTGDTYLSKIMLK